MCSNKVTKRRGWYLATARKDDEKKEYFDSLEELEGKVGQLADWIRESRHFIAFTVSR